MVETDGLMMVAQWNIGLIVCLVEIVLDCLVDRTDSIEKLLLLRFLLLKLDRTKFI